MPETIVQKTIGAIIMRTRPTNPSLSGLSKAPACGTKWPSAMPASMPSRTCRYSERSGLAHLTVYFSWQAVFSQGRFSQMRDCPAHRSSQGRRA